MMLAVLTAAGAVALGAASPYTERVGRAAAALRDGRVRAAQGGWDAAAGTLRGGLAAVHGLPWQQDLADELELRLAVAEQGRADAARAAAARALRQLADRVRFLYGLDDLPPERVRLLAGPCRACWEKRGAVGGPGPDPAVREDLLDLAIFWADLQTQMAPAGEKEAARREALAVLNQAESLCGPSPVLDAERAFHGGSGGPAGQATRALRGAWEHYALGRALLRSGDLGRAAEEVGRAVRLRPQGLWPNFYEGLCAYRQGRYEDAVTAYSVCIGAAPEAAVCFHNRGLARAAQGKFEQARQDYGEAARLDPTLAAAPLSRAPQLPGAHWPGDNFPARGRGEGR
jgi:tetratricopeptide (TPR) repeat protein